MTKRMLKEIAQKGLIDFEINKKRKEEKIIHKVMEKVFSSIKDIKRTGIADILVLDLGFFNGEYGIIKDNEFFKKSYRIASVTHLIKAEGPIKEYKLFGPIKTIFNNLEKEGFNPYIYREERPATFEMSMRYSLRINPKL